MSLALWRPVIPVGRNRFPCEPNALAETLSLSGKPAKAWGPDGSPNQTDFARAIYPSMLTGELPAIPS